MYAWADATRRARPRAGTFFKLARRVLSHAPAGALFLVLVLGAGCRGAAPPAARAAAPHGGSAEALMRGVRVRQVAKGRVTLELRADEAWHARGSGWITARAVRATYFAPGRRPVLLRTGLARYDLDAQRLEADGMVRVESDGGVLQAAGLVWDGRRGRLTSEGRVRMLRGPNVLTGEGLEADPGLDQVTIRDHVRILARDPGELKPLVDGPEAK
jgi:LPS export ABC transporter protein LptC